MVIVIKASVDGKDCFKYIHTVNVSEHQAKANSHFFRWLIKHKVIDGQCDRSRELAPKPYTSSIAMASPKTHSNGNSTHECLRRRYR